MADKTIFLLEIQFLFLESCKRSLHQSLDPDMYFQSAGSGVVQTRLRNQTHLKFIDPELKLTLALLPGAGAETEIARAFYSKTGSKLQPGYFPGAGAASEQTSVNHRYGADTKG